MDGKPTLRHPLTSQEVRLEGLIPEISNRIADKCLADLRPPLPPLPPLPPRGRGIIPKPLKSKKGKKKEMAGATKKPTNAAPRTKTPCTRASPRLAAAAAKATVSATPNMLNFTESPSNSAAPVQKELNDDDDKEGETPGAAGDKEGKTPAEEEVTDDKAEEEVTDNKEGETPSDKRSSC
jgi:hypothetical protein